MSPQELTDKIIGAVSTVLKDSTVVKKANDADKAALSQALAIAMQDTVPKNQILQTDEDAELDKMETDNLKAAMDDPMGMFMISKGKRRVTVTNVRKVLQRMISDTRQGRVDYRDQFNL